MKLAKVDGNFKLAFCDERGNEYKSAKEGKDQTRNLIYTDDALDSFTLVDLHSLKGITGQEENLGKVFSIKPTNSKFSPISIYDGNKNIGSFTDEVGYINRGKFYFKDDHSTSFKVYDENRALVTITKEDGKYKVSLRDGNYIDNNKFLSQSIELSGNNNVDNIDDDIYIKDREYGKLSKREDSLLFKHEPEEEETIEFDEYNFTIRLHYDKLSDDRLQKAIDEVKNNLSDFKTLLGLKENDTSSRELQLYIYNNENNYHKHAGSTISYGHFDPKLNSMYVYQTSHHSGDITLQPVMKIAQNQRVLPKKEVIELDDNLQINLYYNNLSSKQLEAAKKEVKDAFYDFKNLYDMKNPDITNTLSIFIHDNGKDFSRYGDPHTNSYEIGQTSENGTHIAYVYHNQHGGDSLRTQVSYVLSYYNGGFDESKILPDVVEPSSQHVLNQEKTNEIAKLISTQPNKEAEQSYEDDDEDYYGNEKDDDEGSGMQYEMVRGFLRITNNETDETFMVPRKFSYLKLVKDDEGEKRFTLCNKRGKEYTKIGENRYIDIEDIDTNYNFNSLCRKKCLFSIHADKSDSQIAKIFDLKGRKEIGTLYNNSYEEDDDEDDYGDDDSYQNDYANSMVAFESHLEDDIPMYVSDDLI
ncbi:hypothetical protein [Candidatus Mesenet endosymbiont of Agriotes lineatus]|uniref:hypothetical protein n=1 Tax=Candidatus Mesenet endosymbiont of Agriotes lineatus TaxID=3077948 RepID=UPI0030D06840